MRDVVFAYRKLFADIYRQKGRMPLTQYVREMYREATCADPIISRSLALSTSKILGHAVGERVQSSLERNNYVSTVDHHGPLSYPAFFQPHLLRMALDQEQNLPATVVLSCASVSLDNHTFPRGFYFYDEYRGRVRFPLFSLHDRHNTVFGQRPFTKADVFKNIEKVHEYDEIKTVLTEVLSDPALYEFATYRTQITYLNHYMMKRLCPEGGNFVSISIEEVVKDLLCDTVLMHDQFISSILFTKEVRDYFITETNGIQTSHDLTRKDTTMFFWGNRRGSRIPLRVEGEYLCDECGEFRVHLDMSEIQKALHEEIIFPNLAFCLIVLASRGMNLGGGFFQVDYLPSLIFHTQNVATRFHFGTLPWGNGEYLGGDFTFMPIYQGYDVTPLSILKNPPCLTDIAYYGEALTIAEAIDRIIPDMYHILNNKLQNEWGHIVKDTAESR